MAREDIHNTKELLNRKADGYIQLFIEDPEDTRRFINDLLAQRLSAARVLKMLSTDTKYYHGNCKFDGNWDCHKNKQSINAYLSEDEQKLVKNHENFHAALDIFQKSLDCNRDNMVLCDFSNALDDDPLSTMLMPEYQIGTKWHPDGLRERFLDIPLVSNVKNNAPYRIYEDERNN